MSTNTQEIAPEPNDEVSKFGRLVKIVSSKPVASAFTALALAVGFVAYISLTKIDEVKNLIRPTNAEETKFFHAGVKKSLEVTKALEVVRSDIAADRLTIGEFHNNQRSLGGVPWSFTSVRLFAVRPGVDFKLSDSTQGIPNTTYAEIFAEMWEDPRKPKCSINEVASLISSVLRSRLEDRGTQIIFSCPIQDKEGTPLGFVNASYLYLNAPRQKSNQEILDIMGRFANEMGVMLAHKETK